MTRSPILPGFLVASALALPACRSPSMETDLAETSLTKADLAGAAGRELEAAHDVRLAERTNYYDVRGSSAEELGAQLKALGPGGRPGYTDWTVHWRYPFIEGADGYRAGPVTVDVDLTFTLPRWLPPDDAPPILVSRWREFLRLLRAHEDGHARHALAAAEEAADAIRACPPRPSRGEFDAEADRLGENALERARAGDREYDASTDHGVKQGVQFP